MKRPIDINKCLWVSSPNIEEQHVFGPILRAVARRNIKMWSLKDCSAASLEEFRRRVWQSDEHVIFHGMLARELNALRPIFQERRNFSVLLVDWWTSSFWFSQNADYLIFHNYSGIAVRSGKAPFLAGPPPPWIVLPELMIYYQLAGALARLPALAAAPFYSVIKRWQRQHDQVDPSRMVYFPFPIAAEDVPLEVKAPKYDFTNLGATVGQWIIRDPYAPAGLNMANLYRDRQRLIDMIRGFEGQPFTVFDRRRNYKFLPWDGVCDIIRQSQFAVCSGGLQLSSIPKFLEYVCLGTPIIGATLPFEYPWLDACVFPVDMMRVTPAELRPKLDEALELQPKLKENCLAVRDRLLQDYEPGHLIDMLQGQFDGKGIPPGYLKV